MKYSININQKAAISLGINVDMTDLAIFDMLKDYTPCDVCKKLQHDGRLYYSVPYKKVIDELPLLPIKTSDGIYRRFKKLEQSAILEMHPDNAKLSMVWFTWGRNFSAMCFNSTLGYLSDPPDEKPGVTGEDPRMKNRTPPDKYPTHNNTFSLTSLSTRAREGKETVDAEQTPIQTCAGPEVAIEAHDPVAPGVKILDVVPGQPQTPVTPKEPEMARIDLGDRPNAETPAQLEKAMQDFYRRPEWKNEWLDGVCRISGVWIPDSPKKPEQLKGMLSDFCRHAVKNNWGGDTYRMLNAAFQSWVANERYAGWKNQPAKAKTANNPGANATYEPPKNAVY